MPENIPTRDYYADLGLSPHATQDEIKAAFRHLAKLHHPDKQGPEHDGDTSEFRKTREAYEILSDPGTRAAYDQSRGVNRARSNTRQYTPSAEPNADEGEETHRPEPKFSMSEFWSSINPPGGFQRTGTGKFASSNYRAAVPPEFKSHGVNVKMTDHPSVGMKNCPYRAEQWISGDGTEVCIYCLGLSHDMMRCPGCMAVACRGCLGKVQRFREGLERQREKEKSRKFQYMPSGG